MRSPQQGGHRLDAVRIGLETGSTSHVIKDRAQPSARAALCSDHAWFESSAASRHAVCFPKLMVRELNPLR
jgi:hypothetical protein